MNARKVIATGKSKGVETNLRHGAFPPHRKKNRHLCSCEFSVYNNDNRVESKIGKKKIKRKKVGENKGRVYSWSNKRGWFFFQRRGAVVTK